MWPRKRDGSFAIEAITDHLLALVDAELSRWAARPPVVLPAGSSPAASGLHVVHLVAVQLGVLPPGSDPYQVVERIQDVGVRERVGRHLREGDLLDRDMRALADAAGLFLGRANKVDDRDVLQPIDDTIFTLLVVGRRKRKSIERRYVLVLDHREGDVLLADPGGELTTVAPRALRRAGKLGGGKGAPWVATVSVMSESLRAALSANANPGATRG